MVNASALSLASALLLTTGIFFPPLWFFSIIGILPLAHVLYRGELGKRRMFLEGALFGTLYTGGTIIWFWNTLPLDWLGLTNIWLAGALVFVYWGSVAVACGMLFGIFANLFIALKRNDSWDAVIGAALWTIVQFAQLWWFSIFTAGSASLVGAHFSTFLLGYALAWFSPLLQLSALGGVYALTFVAAFFGFMLYRALRGRTRRVQFLALAGIIVASAALTAIDGDHPLSRLLPEEESRIINVALVSTDFTAAAKTEEERKRRGGIQDSLIRSWASENPAPDLLVLPEASELFRTTGQDPAAFMSDVFGGATAVIDSATFTDSEGQRSVRVFSYDASGGLHGGYDKMFLVPQGEYTPYLYAFLPKLFGGKDFARRITETHSLKRGAGVEVVDLGGFAAGSLFCADILSPRLYRELAGSGAQLLVNPASQSLFHGSSLVRTHITAMAKVRAVETSRFLVMAGNTIPSVIITDRGEVLAQTIPGESGVISGSVSLRDTRTPYVILGDSVILFPLLLIAAAVFRRRALAAGSNQDATR